MLDINFVRKNPDVVKDGLKKRGYDTGFVQQVLEIDTERREILTLLNSLREKRNKLTEEIEKLILTKRSADVIEAKKKEVEELKEIIAVNESKLSEIENKFNELMLLIPNIPDETVPVGKDETENKVVFQSGDVKKFDFDVKPHWEIGKSLGILDFELASKISGSRFVVLKGLGAKLERALIDFMIDIHTNEHGYIEIFAPYLVKPEIMQGTGQLPKFDIEMYKMRDDDLYLIPTAEVSVTNLHRDEIIPEDKLPIKYVSYSACFRREAGSYGKDTKGLIRHHQFNKVELVKITKPEDSDIEFEKLVRDAVRIIELLGLTYRIVAVCTGDLGFASAKTYDLEVWMPGEKRWREVSSCSNFKDFQARRMNTRLRRKSGKVEFVHTINGSGLAIGRTMAAILENYQTENEEVIIPDVLRAYFNNRERLLKI